MNTHIPMLGILVGSLSFISCKTTQGGSQVREADAPPSGAVADAILNDLDSELTAVEAGVDVATLDQPADGATGMALADTPPANPSGELLALSSQLEQMTNERVLADRSHVLNTILNLQALAQLDSTLTIEQRNRVNNAIARVRRILADNPLITNDSELECRDLGNQSTLPAVKNGPLRGERNADGKGFQTRANCDNSVAARKNGIVCSIAAAGNISPFQVRTNTRVGPPTAYAQTANCIAAVRDSSTFVCIVDNGAAGSPYSRWSPSTAERIDGTYTSFEKCKANDKSPDAPPPPDPREVCRDECARQNRLCNTRADGVPDSLERTAAKTQCLLDVINCRRACDGQPPI